ncbi:hypothetical protein LOD99_3474 [Oopsacas minuta]|uniref:Uncharacterized protein n=1 Tax=Oopsacas minuta TaxID=111878 RepID=A0AAV7JXD2_9METZ|nr:hypothetical protein LOD99_3474 [Oopsacas minuta]
MNEMFQQKLFNILFFHHLFFFSTILVHAIENNITFPVQENSAPTLQERNTLIIIIIVVCGCIALLPLIFILKCIFICFLRKKYKPREKQGHENLSNTYDSVRPRDSYTSEFNYNINSGNVPPKPFEQPKGYYPSDNPTINNDHPSLDHSYVGMHPVTIQKLQQTDNEYVETDQYSEIELSNRYEEILPLKKLESVNVTSTDDCDVDSFISDTSSRRVNDVISPSNPHDDYEGMMPIKSVYELDSFTSDTASRRVNEVISPSNPDDDYEGMMPIKVKNEYELDSLTSYVDKPYYDTLGSPLHYDYITIATPPSNKPRKSPSLQPNDSFTYDELSPSHQ